MKVKIFNTFSKEIIDMWKSLENQGSSTIFQSLNWILNWYENVGLPVHKIELCIVSISLEGKLNAILPMGISASKTLKKLVWLGGIHSDYLGPIISRKNSIEYNFDTVWNEVIRLLPSFDLIYLDKQPPLINDCRNPFFDMKNVQIIGRSYQADIENGWDEYSKTIPKKVLSDTSRQRRRLAKLGNLSYQIIEKNDLKNEFFKELFKFKSMRYKEMGIKDILKKNEHKKFYLEMPMQINSLSQTHLSVLKLNEEIIALHWGAFDQNTFYYLMPAYSCERWEKFSPGKILLEELIISCTQMGINMFDFTIGDEQYKKIWSNKSFVVGLLIQAASFKGKVYIVYLNLRKWFARLSNIKKILMEKG